MKKITTETGSVYLLDEGNQTWSRVLTTDRSGSIRTEKGTFVTSDLCLGRRMNLTMEPLPEAPENVMGRLISTSIVTKVEEVD